jgi:ComF family protein
MAGHLADRPVWTDIVTEVPLHSRRLKQRGYNQSELLARELAKRTGIAHSRSLKKDHQTRTQVDSGNSRLRRKNVEQAFSCTDHRVRGRRVLLVDDVATTGATLDACAGALKAAGAVRVRGLTLAREI